MSRRIAVKVLQECFIAGAYRRPGQIFMVDEHLVDPMPSCLERVRRASAAEDDQLVEVSQP